VNPHIGHVFVYGTLRPGDVRWRSLEPFAVDSGWDDAVRGRLLDTGSGYPGADFDPLTDRRVVGRTVALLAASRRRALEVLDGIEGVDHGLYARVLVRTERGVDAWSYAYGSVDGLPVIASGDWFLHRPPSR
jgi:gamma-glutamylcyclotransferase (GGCT)/AIG2-like uncharacterized protein YtfP